MLATGQIPTLFWLLSVTGMLVSEVRDPAHIGLKHLVLLYRGYL